MNYQGFAAAYNPYIPYQQQYMGQPMQQAQQVQQMQQMTPGAGQGQGTAPQEDDRVFVSGPEEAEHWVVIRGQSVRLWDRNGQTFYVKAVSASGQPLPLEVYDYRRRDAQTQQQEVAPPPAPAFNPDDFVTHDEFDEFKKQMAAKKRPVKKEEVIIDADEQ